MTIVVTADDLGLSPGVTRGILEAHKRGVVRSASLMVTFASSPEAAALSRLEPDLEVGLHLDLVGGEPVSDPARVASLCDKEGRFWRLPEFTRRLFTGRIRASDLATEVLHRTVTNRCHAISAIFLTGELTCGSNERPLEIEGPVGPR